MSLAAKGTETEDLFETLANKSPVGVYIVQDGKFCYTNPTFQSTTGYTEDELLGRNSLELVFPEDRKIVRENAIKMLKEELTPAYQFRVIHKTGSIRWVMESVVPIQYRGRRATLGNFVDITERKRTEKALQASEEMYKTVVEDAPIGIYYNDFNGTFLYGNKKAEEIIGYKKEELLGKGFLKLKLLRPEGIAKAAKLLALNKLGKATGPDLFTLSKKDGTTSIVEIRTKVSTFSGKKAVLGMVEDITERKRAEEALQSERNKLQSLIDAMEDTITIQDKEYNIIFQNEPSKIASSGDHLGEKCYRAYEGREVICEDCPVEKAFKDGKSHTAERRTEISGNIAFWENTSNPIRDAEGRIVSCLELARDVTERKKQEQALADELTQRRLLINKSLDAIVVLDEDAKVVEANQRFANMLGYTLEEVYKLHTWDWDKEFPPEKILEMGRNVDEKGLHLETKHTRKDGSVFDVDISISGIMCGGQKLIFCIDRDITERNRAKEALKQAAQEWRETFDSISDAISIHDRDFRILRANKAFADIFQMKPNQIIGKHCYELLHGKEKSISGCPHQQTLATGKPVVAEAYESSLGKYLLVSTSPIFNGKGDAIGTVHIVRDITEQKQQRERLMMADRLASMGEMAAGAAHELNNPLTSVIGFSQLLMGKDIPDDIRDDVKLIHDQAQRAVDITKNLLTFARKRAPVKQPTQINNIIEDVLKLRAYEHKINNIEVKRRLAHDLPEIKVDYFQMQQVFLNLIINAEYFMIEAHNRGTLTITTKKRNGSVRISIADDGPGISEDNMSRIFNPFFTTKETGKGTGLGLSICHGIVIEHGGQIYAESQPGKGATFVIELPIKSP